MGKTGELARVETRKVVPVCVQKYDNRVVHTHRYYKHTGLICPKS